MYIHNTFHSYYVILKLPRHDSRISLRVRHRTRRIARLMNAIADAALTLIDFGRVQGVLRL